MTRDEFLAQLALEYPKTAKEHDVAGLVIPTLIAPVSLRLPVKLWNEAERLVSLFYNKVRGGSRGSPSQRASVLMSYDFHLDFSHDPAGRLRLIEINTNASSSLITALIEATHAAGGRRVGAPNGASLKATGVSDFESELGGTLHPRSLAETKIAIVDDAPSEQKLYIEFLLYRELFEQRGAKAAVADRRDLVWRSNELWLKNGFGPIDLVYNRSTDFYFAQPESVALKMALEQESAVITPEPGDYRALADKSRMIEWSADGALEAMGLSSEESEFVRSALIRTRAVSGLDPDALWAERKALMFKPQNAFGGKAVYRGSSISRGTFQKIIDENSRIPFVVQEFVPAPTVMLTASGSAAAEYKYDLRFYAYRDRVSGACARLYQGQMTNATTPGGGVAAIEWVSSN